MSNWNESIFWPILSLVLISFLGNGFIWEYKKINIEKDKIQIEKEKLAIDKDKLGIDKSKFSLEEIRSDIDVAKQKYDIALLEIEKDRRRAENDRLAIEREKSHLDQETHDMAKTKELISLLKQKGELLLSVTSAYIDLAKLKTEYSEITRDKTIADIERARELQRDMLLLDVKLTSLKNEFLAVESKLARVEGRPIQNIEVYFPRPSAPSNLR